PQAYLAVTPLAFGEPTDGRAHVRQIVRVDDLPPHIGMRRTLLEAQSREREGSLVRVENAPLHVDLDDVLGHEVEDHAELALVLSHLVVGLLPIGDVGPGDVPAEDPSLRVAQWRYAHQEPSVLAVASPEAGLGLPCSRAGKPAFPSRQKGLGVVRMHEVPY